MGRRAKICGAMSSAFPLPEDWQPLDKVEVPGRTLFLVEGLIHRGSTIIFGRPEAGKSIVAQSLAWSAQNCDKWLGRKVNQTVKVAYLPLDPQQHLELKQRAEGMAGVQPYVPKGPLRRTSQDYSGFVADLKERGFGLIIIDNLLRLIPLGQSVRNDEGVQPILSVLDLVMDAGIGVVLVHHAGKPGENGIPKTPTGSTAIESWARHLLRVERQGSALIITSYGNSAEEFQIKARIDLTHHAPTPFLTDVAEGKPKEHAQAKRDQERMNEARAIAEHLNKHQGGGFKSVAAAAQFLVALPPPGVSPASEPTWRQRINNKLLKPGLYVKDGRTIRPNLDVL